MPVGSTITSVIAAVVDLFVECGFWDSKINRDWPSEELFHVHLLHRLGRLLLGGELDKGKASLGSILLCWDLGLLDGAVFAESLLEGLDIHFETQIPDDETTLLRVRHLEQPRGDGLALDDVLVELFKCLLGFFWAPLSERESRHAAYRTA